MSPKPTTATADTNTKNQDNGQTEKQTAKELMEHVEKSRFANLRVDRSKGREFAGTARTIDPQVKEFVEQLYQAFEDDPDKWWPVELDSDEDTTKSINQARTYAAQRSPRITINVRRDPESPDTLTWWRAAGYTKRSRT